MKRLKTALVGFGKIGAGYADDPKKVRFYPYATHAQVLRDHPAFEWVGVVDPSDDALERAKSDWAIENVAKDSRDFCGGGEIEVAVIATPPNQRLEVLEAFPNLCGVLVEKPIGETVEQGREFVAECRRRGISLAVNLFRRFDNQMLALADGGLREIIGEPQTAFMTFGNGLINNGVHMIDLVHMLLGDSLATQAFNSESVFKEGPISNDLNFPFTLQLKGGVTVMASPIHFSAYRENGLDVWGSRGRIQLVNEGLTRIVTHVGPNRAMTGAKELIHEASQFQCAGIVRAMYEVYENLADHLHARAPLKCDGETALRAELVIDVLFRSQKAGGRCLSAQYTTAHD